MRRCRLYVLLMAPLITATPSLAVEVEEVRFENEGTTLAASLYLPASDDPVPGIMMIQGSGTSSRENIWARNFAEELSARGYAVVFPDKRGSGKSGGDWHQVGFETLAGDAIAGAEVMRQLPRVDPGRVGYIGLSQGGHIAPLAAKMDPRTAFAINVVGSLKTMEQQVYDELELSYRKYGLNDETIAYLQEMAYASFDYIRTGEGWDRYIQRHREISAGPLSPATEIWPTSQDDPYWDFWRHVWDYDPKPHWRHIVLERDVPSLMIWGTGDRNVKVEESVALAEELESDTDFTVNVYEGGGHALWNREKDGLRKDMLQDLERWLGEVTEQ